MIFMIVIDNTRMSLEFTQKLADWQITLIAPFYIYNALVEYVNDYFDNDHRTDNDYRICVNIYVITVSPSYRFLSFLWFYISKRATYFI